MRTTCHKPFPSGGSLDMQASAWRFFCRGKVIQPSAQSMGNDFFADERLFNLDVASVAAGGGCRHVL